MLLAGGRRSVNIQPLAENDYSLDESTVTVTVPAHSVVTLALRPATGTGQKPTASPGSRFSIKSVPHGKIVPGCVTDHPVPVRFRLYGIDGRTILDSFAGTVGSGRKRVEWRPDTRRAGTGIYILRIEGDDFRRSYRLPIIY